MQPSTRTTYIILRDLVGPIIILIGLHCTCVTWLRKLKVDNTDNTVLRGADSTGSLFTWHGLYVNYRGR
jgi:hypothetical protein